MSQVTPSRKVTVLIADDMADTRENVIRLLDLEKDIEVIGGVSDGQQAIEMARKVSPDVVLLDVSMPVVDGISAAAAIRESGCGSAVIMMSIRDDVQYFRQAMLAGARDFLTKPFSGQDLVQAIRGVCELSERVGGIQHSPSSTAVSMPRGFQWADHRRISPESKRPPSDTRN